jgi:hypothetical protein
MLGTCAQAGTDLGALDTTLSGAAIDLRHQVQVLWAEFVVKCPGLLEQYQP